MALRSGTPVNLSSLQRDYSALPKIAAIKAQANQGIFDTIKKGIDDRKQKIKDADEKAATIKVIESIKNSPFGKSVFGEENINAEDIYSSLGKRGTGELVGFLSNLSKANIATTEFIQKQQLAREKSIIDNVLRLNQGGVSDEDISKNLNVNLGDVKGIITNSKKAFLEKAPSKLMELEELEPGIIDYVKKLAMIPKEKGQAQGSGIGAIVGLGKLTGKEYEAGFGDVEANEKFNVLLRTNRDLLEAYQVPDNTIEDIMQLKSDLPNELGTKTRYRVQELNSAARPFE